MCFPSERRQWGVIWHTCSLWSEKGVTVLDMCISYQSCHRLYQWFMDTFSVNLKKKSEAKDYRRIETACSMCCFVAQWEFPGREQCFQEERQKGVQEERQREGWREGGLTQFVRHVAEEAHRSLYGQCIFNSTICRSASEQSIIVTIQLPDNTEPDSSGPVNAVSHCMALLLRPPA